MAEDGIDIQIESCLDEFNETLRTLRADDDLGVSCAPRWEAVRCLDECELYQFLCREYPSEVDRDTLVLAYSQLSRCKGKPNEIQAAMGRYHFELSPESPNTRGSDRLMRQREVVREGNTLLCEWHAKLERHRNRIHFSAPSEMLAGRILIGIFVSHLDT